MNRLSRASLVLSHACIACCVAALLAAYGFIPVVAWASEDTLTVQETADKIVTELAQLEPGEDYEENTVLVSVKPDAATSEVKAALDASDVEGTQNVSVERVSDDLMRVELADGASVPEAVADLQLSGLVDAAQPNYLLYVQEDETETLAARLGLCSVGGIDDYGTDDYNEYWHLLSINADRVWADASTNVDDMVGLGVTSSQKVGVAVVDESFCLDHEDLSDNIAGAYNACTQQAGTSDNMLLLSRSHGSHVAGIIGACANNAKGVAGVSYNARIVPVRVSNDSGQIYTSTVVEAYEYIIDHKDEYNIKVANLSIGTSMPGFDGSVTQNDSLLQAIDNAYSEGIVTVCAAGNSGVGVKVPADFYPGDYGTVVSVIGLAGSSSGATERERAQEVSRSKTSNYNADGETDKNISAPGNDLYSTTNGGTYAYQSGTSMAAPVVSGVLALMFSADDDLTIDEAKSILYKTAREVGGVTYTDHWSEGFGYGEVDAYAAVSAVRAAEVESTTWLVSGAQYLKVGEAYDYSVSPARGTWSYASSDEQVIAFSDATGTATGAGTATVSASGTVNNVSAEALSLTVSAFGPMSSVSTLAANETSQASVAGPDGYAWDWESSDEGVATVSSNGLIRGVAAGTTEITATLVVSEGTDNVVSFTKTLQVTASSPGGSGGGGSGGGGSGGGGGSAPAAGTEVAVVETAAMHRLYNPNSGEHFYTVSSGERDMLVAQGWRSEGIGWHAPKTSNVPVYRLYNPNGGDHHYTTSAGERDLLVAAGWRYEGIGWYSDENRGVPLYRQYNPNATVGAHNFTVSASERDALIRAGWRNEGTAWYGVKVSS